MLIAAGTVAADAAGYSVVDSVSSFIDRVAQKKNSGVPENGIANRAGLVKDNILLSKYGNVAPAFLLPSYNTLDVAITENFNSMGNSGTAALPTDWRFGSATTYSTGVTAATLAAGTTGTGAIATNSGGGYYNFANGVNGTSTDRAPGWLSATGFTSPRQLFVRLTNNTGSTIGSADIAYDIEKYRNGQRAFTIAFYTSTDGTNWNEVTAASQTYALSGNNNPVNPATTISKSFTVTGLSIANGSDLYLRWSYTGNGGSSNGQGLGIDNFSFTPHAAVPGALQFDATSYSELEGGTKTINVNRVGGTLGAVSVDYATGGGVATGGAACTAGVDYISRSGTLNWAGGDTAAKSFTVEICPDSNVEIESFNIALSNTMGGATIGGTNPVAISIIDNSPGTLQFTSATFNGAENLPFGTVYVSRTDGSGGPVSVNYAAIAGGSANIGTSCTAGVDYMLPPGTLNWASMDTADKHIDIQLCPDTITYEGPETINLELSSPSGAILGAQTTATYTITDVAASFFNNSLITIPEAGASSPYPSTIDVAGVPGNITEVSISLYGVTHTYPDDVDILLVSPAGQKFMVQSDAGGGGNINNRSYDFMDSAANFMQDEAGNPSGSYKPTNYDGAIDDFQHPAPDFPYSIPGPAGTDTFSSAFAGSNPNGTWSLFVVDSAGPDGGSINAGWALRIVTEPASGPGNVQFATAAYSVDEGGTSTVTVSRVSAANGAISVDYATGGGTATGGAACTAGVDYINASGTLTWGDNEIDPKTFTVQTCADALTAETNETVDVALSNPQGGATITGTNPAVMTVTNNDFAGSVYSNTNSITIPDSGSALPYPSTINVSGFNGTIGNIRVRINGWSHTYGEDTQMLLVGPQGQNLVFLANAGGGSPVNNVNLLLTDSASGHLPSSTLASGIYKPTNYGVGDFFPSPAPTSPYNDAGPDGAQTLMGVYGGTNPNGNWHLYIYDRANGDQGSIANGWALELQSADTVQFAAATFSAMENAGTATALVTRSITDGAFTVDYSLGGGSATGGTACSAGIDYVNTGGTVNFAVGENSKPINITICDDAVFDGLETFNVTLSNPAGGATQLGNPNPAQVQIIEDETAPTISINDLTFSESAGVVSFQVTQSFVSPVDTTFQVSTVDGTAIAPGDYAPFSAAPVIIQAGQASTTVDVTIVNDANFEETETFSVMLSNAVNATIVDGTGTGTITDDDVAATYLVNTTNDIDNGICDAAHCSLREAIIMANGAAGVINFAPNVTGTITFGTDRPGIYNHITINGPGAELLTISGGNAIDVFSIGMPGVEVTIKGLTISNGRNMDFGYAGAITSQGNLTIMDSVITGNKGSEAGGIIIYGNTTIIRSTLSNNIGGRDGQPACANVAGAISVSANISLNVINSTLSGNSVSTSCSYNNGAIMVFDGRLTLTGSTVTNNTSGGSFSGAVAGGTQNSIIRNSIIAGNTGNRDILETFSSQGYNIIGNRGSNTAFNQPTDQTGTSGSPLNAMLSPLANNGGRTMTHALLSGSPAIDKGKSFGLATDQRGRPRPFDDPAITNAVDGDGSEIGAYEISAANTITVTGGPLSFGNVAVGAHSAEQSYTVSGSDLTGNLTITAPPEFEVSASSGTDFGPSVVFVPTSGTVGASPVYVRFSPTSAGAKSGDITNASPGAQTRNVAVSGTGATPGALRFSSATYSTAEGSASHVVSVPVQRIGGSSVAVSINYAVTDGTATTADNDYTITPATGTLSWPDGDSADKNILITINGDAVPEPNETINLALSAPTGGATLGTPATAVLTITDDDQPTLSVDDVTFTGANSIGPAGFTVGLSTASSQTVTVHYKTANGTALATQDYVPLDDTLTFNPGETSKFIPVTILPDTVNEPTEEFFLDLDTPVNATIAKARGIGTIPNDDPVVTFSISDVSQAEGDSGTTAFNFTITKTGSTTQTASVEYTTSNGSASGGSDFAPVNNVLVSFASHETSKQVTVFVNGDTDFEGDETFTVTLSAPVNATIGDSQGTGTIVNDDLTPPIYLVNVNDDTDDGACNVAHCSLREAINAVNAIPGQINFAPNVTGEIVILSFLPSINTSAAIVNGPGANVLKIRRDASATNVRILTIFGNTITVSGLTFEDGAHNFSGSGIYNNSPGVLTIRDCAFNNNVSGAGGGAAINHSSESVINVINTTFTNNRTASGVGGAISSVYGGSRLVISGSTFTNNRAELGGAISQQGGRIEISGSTITGSVSSYQGGAIYNGYDGRVDITDSRLANNTAGSQAGAIANDGAGTLNITRSTISGNVGPQGGGALSNNNGTITITASTVSGNSSISNGGAMVGNGAGTFNIINSTVSGNTANGMGGGLYHFSTNGHVSITGSTFTANTGGWGGAIAPNPGTEVTLRNSIVAGNTGTQAGPDIYGAATSGGYNLIGNTGMLTMTPATDDQINVAPQLGPLQNNGGPTFTHLPQAGSPAIDAGSAFSLTTDQRGFARTADNPAISNVGDGTDIGAVELAGAAAQIVAYSGTPQSVYVGDDYAPLQARVLDSNGTPVSGVTVTFQNPPGGPSALFPGGFFSATAVTDINGIATSPVMTAYQGPGLFETQARYAPHPVWAAFFELTNKPKPGISVNDVTFTGADSIGPMGFTVSLSESSPETITVNYATADGTAIAGEDYDAVNGTLTFNPGETSKSIPINILPDTVNEDTEQFVINLSSPGANATIADGQGIGTIPNDDPAPTFSINDVTQAEGTGGTTDFTFTITKTGSTALTSVVSYQTGDGSAVAPGDYTTLSNSVTFQPNETTKQVTVSVNADSIYEGNETFTLNLTGATNGTITGGVGTGTITNDDAAPAFSVGNVSLNEGDSGTTAFTFTVTKTGATELNASVNYRTENGTAVAGSDFTGISSTTLNFLPAETSKQVTVDVTGDTVYENNESFTVELSSEANATIADGSGLGTIVNDDAQPSFSIGDVTQSEGNSGSTNFSFVVTKTGATEVTSNLSWFIINGTATSQENDFIPATGEIEIHPGDTTSYITIQVTGDTIYENDETFEVEIGSAQHATITDNRGLGTIINDDAAPTIAIDDVTMTEGDSGTKTFTFTVTKTGLTAFNGSFGYVVQDATATAADDDFEAASDTVSMLAGETSKTVSVTVNGDAKFEADETFNVALQNEAGLVVTRRVGVGTITNDDTAPTVSINDVTFTGADSLVKSGFTVSLNGASGLPVSVHYQSVNDTAIAGQDYDAVSGTLNFAPGETTKTIPVNILPDTVQEATEQFFVDLDTPVGATIADDRGIGTIPNDDAGPAFSINDVTQAEGSGGSTTFTFTVTKTGETTLASGLNFATADNSATGGASCSAGVDYVTTSGTLNFAAAETSKQINVTVCGDTIVETDEPFFVSLSGLTNGTFSDNFGQGTIQNDTTPAVGFESATYLEDESQTAVITVVRTGDLSGMSTVEFATSNGTANGNTSCSILGTDFINTTGTITFAPTESTQTVNVPVCADSLFETTFETVNLTLSSPSAGTILNHTPTAVLNINDTASQYRSTAPITILSGTQADPSMINVTNAPSVGGTVRITIYDLVHSNPDDLDILLVSPTGVKMVLMADAGGSNPLTGSGATLTFDDMAGAVLPDSALITTRKYEPTSWGTPVSSFMAPAPAGPYAEPGSNIGGGVNLNSVFGSAPPNGVWTLYIRDDNGSLAPFGTGGVGGGWGLQFLAPTSANASIAGRVLTADGLPISNAVVTLSGPGIAEPIVYRTGHLGTYNFDELPVGRSYTVSVGSQRYTFANPVRVINLQDNAVDENFTAQPRE